MKNYGQLVRMKTIKSPHLYKKLDINGKKGTCVGRDDEEEQ